MIRTGTFIIALSIIIASCSNDEPAAPDLPKEKDLEFLSRENAITAGNIGSIRLGDSLSTILTKFPPSAVEEIQVELGERRWTRYRVILSRSLNYYISAESTQNNGLIDRVRINHPGYTTVDGIAPGQNLFKAIDGKRSLTSLPDGFLHVFLLDRNIAFTVDSVSEANFLKTNSMELDALLPNTTIREIIIGQPLDSARKIPVEHEHEFE